MNICVIGVNSELANSISDQIASRLQLAKHEVDFTILRNLQKTEVVEPVPHWVISNIPTTVEEYKLLSWSGYNPDLVIYISDKAFNDGVIIDRLNEWYSDAVISIFDSREKILERTLHAVYENM